MYEDYLGQKPFVNEKIIQNVHYGYGMDNAFYEQGQLYYGDGDYLFYPMVALDVVAHEIAHGFTAEYGAGTEKLMIDNHARAINESFSDMSGEAAEFFLTGSNDWKSNEESYKFGALRYLVDPTADGVSVAHMDNYYSQLEAHYGAGIFNKAFHRLATLTGTPWNTKYAFIAFAKGNQICWTANATFIQAADCVKNQGGAVALRLGDDGITKSNSNPWTEEEMKNDIRKAFAYVGIGLKTNKGIESEFNHKAKFLSVTFNNLSRSEGIDLSEAQGGQGWQWSWDFGDGSAANTDFKPTHAFPAEGTFQVTLTITDPTGKTDSIILPVEIVADYCEVNGTNSEEFFAEAVTLNGLTKESGAAAYSDYTADIIQIKTGLKIPYEVETGIFQEDTTTNKNVQIWLDTNQDGRFHRVDDLQVKESTQTSVTGKIPFIGAPGDTYRMRIIVTFSVAGDLPCGTKSNAEIEDYTVEWVDDAPVNLSIRPRHQINQVYFNNATFDTRVVTWEWDFGDGTPIDSEKSPTHRYAKNGDYSVSAKAYDVNAMLLHSWQQDVNFQSTTKALFTPVLNGRTVSLSINESIMPAGSTFLWSLGDTTTAATDPVQHTYMADSNYTVRLTITNEDNPSGVAVDKVITIGERAFVPSFDFRLLRKADDLYEIEFTSSTVDPTDKKKDSWQFKWDYGDNKDSSYEHADLQNKITHIYTEGGKYTVTLYIRYKQTTGVAAADWKWREAEVPLEISIQSDAVLEYCPAEGVVDQEHIAKVTVNEQEFVTGKSGGFVNEGNPIILNLANNEFYIEAGYETVDKFAENYHIWIDFDRDGQFGNGDWAKDKSERVVKAFDYAGGDKGVGYIQGLFSLSEDKLRSGTTKTRLRIFQLYGSTPAEHINPCSVYSDYGGTFGEVEDYEVQWYREPVFSIETESLTNQIVFNNQTVDENIMNWQWSFGDSTKVNEEKSPVHGFYKTGLYEVKATALDSNGQLVGTWVRDIEFTTVTIAETKVDADKKTITADASQSSMPIGSVIKWDFGDGHTSSEVVATHVYKRKGDYVVTFSIVNPDNPSGVIDTHDVSITDKAGSLNPLSLLVLWSVLLIVRRKGF